MHIKFILTDSLHGLQQLSSGRFYTSDDFLSENYTRVLVVKDSNIDFTSINISISGELDCILLHRGMELTHSIYTDIDLSIYDGTESFINFKNINGEIHSLDEYYIQYDNYADYIFNRAKPTSFENILYDLKAKQIKNIRRLSNGKTITKSTISNAFTDTYTNNTYDLTSDDILAEDWIDDRYRLYPTTIKYDTENSMCKIYYDLHDTYNGLPLAEIFSFIIGNDEYLYTENSPTVLLITRIKDRRNYFKNVLNNIFDVYMDNLYETSHIEVFDPSIDSSYCSITFLNNHNIETVLHNVKIIIDSDTTPQDLIDQYLNKYGNHVLVVSLSSV